MCWFAIIENPDQRPGNLEAQDYYLERLKLYCMLLSINFRRSLNNFLP